jgi:hypothetical protein
MFPATATAAAAALRALCKPTHMQAAPLNTHVSSWRLLLLLSLLLVFYLGLLTWHVHVHACWCRPQSQALPPHIILVHLYSHANLQGNKKPTAEVKRAVVLACRNRPGQHTAFCCFPLHPLSVTLQYQLSMPCTGCVHQHCKPANILRSCWCHMYNLCKECRLAAATAAAW